MAQRRRRTINLRRSNTRSVPADAFAILAQHGTMPNHNRDYWKPKIARNRIRDLRQVQLLDESGWRALRFWTHEQPDQICDRIESELDEARQALGS